MLIINIKPNFSLNTVSRNSLNRGINYIAERWESIDAEQDTYTLAIVTYALHQSNHPQKDGASRLLDSVAKKVGISNEQIIVTVDKHANTSAASIPLALNDAVMNDKIKKGDIVLLAAMGGGFTWGSSIIRW